jgi:hypothetical protein
VKGTLLQRDGDFRNLFDTRNTFVNASLAQLYGIPGVNGQNLQAVSLPANGRRLGFLTTAGFLAMNARNTRTSPTIRGKFIDERFLCWEPGDPPANVNQNAIDNGTSGTWQTMRERLAVHRANPACAGCHDTLDPPGLALEHFDGMGAWRDTDHGRTLDVTGDLGALGAGKFDGATGLASALRQNPRVADCLARQTYRYATGHRETQGEEPVINAIAQNLAGSGFKVRGLVKDLVASDGFRFLADSR